MQNDRSVCAVVLLYASDVIVRRAKAIRGTVRRVYCSTEVYESRQAACVECIPVPRNDEGRRRKVPRAGFAVAQDDIGDSLRDSSHAFAYFHDT